jgi:hypothetical protein
MSFTFSPRVVGTNRADFTDIESFLNFKKFIGKKDEDFILAIYDYLTSKEDGTYHWWDMEESKGDPTMKGRVIDPVKLLNVYGFMICGQMATVLYRIFTTAGYKARQFGAPGHSISEVYYDNSWHFLDVDMWTWFKNKNNKIASAYELSRDAFALIVDNTNKSNPCNLPDRTLKGYAEMFHELGQNTKGNDIDTVWPDYSIQSHTMDFHLRPGEALTRSTKAMGRYHLPDRFKPMINRSSLQNEWKGSPSERYAPFRTYGNGLWVYEPNLSNTFQDYEWGIWESSKITTNQKGLTGEGYSVFRMLSPYVFCGKPIFENNTITTSEGVFISLKGKGQVTIEISNVENDWVKIKEWSGDFEDKLDVSEIFDGRYHALIKISQKLNSIVEKFKFEGFIQTAPLAIPRLEKGDNQFSVLEKDRFGQKTVPFHMPVDFRENKGLGNKILNCVNGVVQIERPGWLAIFKKEEKNPVQATFKFDLPANKKMAWCYLHASIKETKWGSEKGFAKIESSEDGIHWLEVCKREISQTKLYWDCSMESHLPFKNHVATIYFRITSDTNISGFHCFGHIAENDHQGKLQIEHLWCEGTEDKSFSAPENIKNYHFNCNEKPNYHSITMKVPSLPQLKI